MSSSSEVAPNNGGAVSGSNDHAQWFKKRHLQRACDLCKKKKVRCDGNQMSDSRCSNCVAHKSSCTYVEAMKRKGPLEKYVDYLENRVDKLEKLLRKLPPDSDILKEFNGLFDSSEVQMIQTSTDNGFRSVNALILPPQGIHLPTQRSIDSRALKEEQEDDGVYDVLAHNLSGLTIDHTEHHYYGKSSVPMLIQTAIEFKKDFTTNRNNSTTEPVISHERQRCWDVKPWEISSLDAEVHKFQFPSDDFIRRLIDLYFEHINLFFPLLHRPTFERSVAKGLHHTDYWFGALLLLVCATGAQHADDSRVLLDGELDYRSSGWRWFQQVQLARQNVPGPSTIYNLQLHCLTILYLQTTSASQSCWVMLGTAIRLAQDGGAHLKRKKDAETWTLEDELQIRAFWVLASMDIDMSCTLGRPCSIQAENFDLDYPLEVDDDYWEHDDPKQSFKQPQGKPSLITTFNLLLKLYQLRAFALATIYSTTRSKMRLGYVGDDWKQQIITELDSALNKWVDGIPDYLRWDPNRENQQHFRQSVLLYTRYYYVRIRIHQPFIPRKSSLSLPSLIICTSAARSCGNIIDVMRKRQLDVAPFVQLPAFTSGVILLLNIWSAKRCGLSTDPQKEMSMVYKCIEVLRAFESRWVSAGQLLGALEALASVGDPSLLNANSQMSHSKRDRQGDILDTRQPGTLEEILVEPRVIAGSQRVSRAVPHVELIAAAHLLHEQSITPQLHQQHIQQHRAPRQPHQPVYDFPLNTNYGQGQEHLNFLNQFSSSFTGEIAQHDRNVHDQVDSWLPSINADMNADMGHQTTWFTYHQLELSTLTRSEAQTQAEMQTTTYNPIVGTGTAMSGMEVMGRSPVAQGLTANEAQWWHDSGPANSTASSDFQFQNWAGRPGVPHFEHKHPKTSQHHPQLRQVRTGPSAGSPSPLPPQQDHHQHRHHDQQALPAPEPFATHPQPSQPTATMHQRDVPPQSPIFMEPLLSPRPHQPVLNHNTLQMWAGTDTSSELANWSTY